MLTYMDIFSRVINSVPDPAACPVYSLPGLFTESYADLYAWIFPDNTSALIMTAPELEQFGLLKEKYFPMEWVHKHLMTSSLISPEDLISEKRILAGANRRVWFNRSADAPISVDMYPIDNRLYTRYKLRDNLLYQSLENPYPFYFTTQNVRVYALVLTVRLKDTANLHEWRNEHDKRDICAL